MPLQFGPSNRQPICHKLVVIAPDRIRGHRVPAHPVRIGRRAQIRGSLSLEAGEEEEPFHLAAGVALPRSEAEEEDQLRIREAEVEVRLGLSVALAQQQSLHKVRVQRLCFCVEEQVREVAAVLPVGVEPHLQPVAQVRAHLLKRSDRSAGHLPLRVKTVH